MSAIMSAQFFSMLETPGTNTTEHPDIVEPPGDDELDHTTKAILNVSVAGILLVCIFVAYCMVSKKLNK